MIVSLILMGVGSFLVMVGAAIVIYELRSARQRNPPDHHFYDEIPGSKVLVSVRTSSSGIVVTVIGSVLLLAGGVFGTFGSN